ncbi:Protein bem46 [Pseudocercospora fuligena]|uniref:Protein bem46 n=1 Tax=Pseudocercospora fuligena TaxID=685502 RepID=A0A8H6VLS2_9PEZI|nr:Protein bem46 [Pseudocercospora fuligena]
MLTDASALYAHKFNTLFLQDVHDGEVFGFSKNQVTPFNLRTPDGETLYAWHVLPLDQYALHEKAIRTELRTQIGPVEDFTSTTAFQLLKSDDARVVISFHGNAGHVAQNWRPITNRFMATRPNTHVFTIDYRGFGHSTGDPTEAGLITDGITLVKWIMEVARIPPERIVILGQSLGTAVSSAVALHFADAGNELLPRQTQELSSLKRDNDQVKPIVFAGVVLAAPFNSVPTLLLTYRIGGLLPLLLPLRPVPWFANLLTSQMVDKWETAERLTAYYQSLAGSPRLTNGSKQLGSLQIVHALDDADIPYRQTEMICRRILDKRGSDSELDPDEIDAKSCIGEGGAGVLDVKRNGRPRLRFELVRYGGHNRIITYSPVAVAVARAFDDLFD